MVLTSLNKKNTNPSPPIVVRLFEDGWQFVIKSELLKAIDPNSNYMERVDYGYETIQMKEVFEKYKDHIDRIEFICTPIRRTKHKAVPIRLVENEEFCVLAVDALFELLREIIFGIKLFQYVEEWPLSLFRQILSVFDSNLNNQYFINLRVFNDLKKSINAAYSSPPSPPPKDVRNAKKDGFTVQNLKNELKHLGLEKHFPEISDHAEIAYTHVMEVKIGRYLRTCDLYDAVEICQLRCIFNRVPELRIFLYHQKGDVTVSSWLTDIPIPERIKPVLTPKTEEMETKMLKDSEQIDTDQEQKIKIGDNIDRITSDVNKESESKVESLRPKLMKKEEEIVNFKRDALIHEKTVKGFKELEERIVDLEAREKELIEERQRDALAHEKTEQAWKIDIVRHADREKELIEERTRNESVHSKTVLENERLMRENASFRSQLKHSNDRTKS
ncbi:hypothetical protein GCK72_011798 [Caenorhabditis remanei]|uniref:Uncharacterized protein n=1 Tax=Caenorhabditis remanei TaxID=31234 RepID=A0A6A5HAY6_CAERE|nr:hypothetical protein GCK72_011798 [Caenorhabditis remanei]KAF1763532.1 hypothetical protein GCK72_011798 [Caenorhabditis remanei]